MEDRLSDLRLRSIRVVQTTLYVVGWVRSSMVITDCGRRLDKRASGGHTAGLGVLFLGIPES